MGRVLLLYTVDDLNPPLTIVGVYTCTCCFIRDSATYADSKLVICFQPLSVPSSTMANVSLPPLYAVCRDCPCQANMLLCHILPRANHSGLFPVWLQNGIGIDQYLTQSVIE